MGGWGRGARLRRAGGSRYLNVAVFVLCLGVCGAAKAAADVTAVERGRVIVEANCARCHAVGPTGESPFAPAPPFRDLHERYPVEDLAEALAEGIVSGHPDMPEFTFEPDQVDDIIAYLQSLSP